MNLKMIKQTEQGFEFWYQIHFIWDWFTKREERVMKQTTLISHGKKIKLRKDWILLSKTFMWEIYSLKKNTVEKSWGDTKKWKWLRFCSLWLTLINSLTYHKKLLKRREIYMIYYIYVLHIMKFFVSIY